MKVSIIGGSGFAGGELTRLLLQHPSAEVVQVTSRKNVGKPISMVHPNFNGRTNLKFTMPDADAIARDVDVVFVATPHGTSQKVVPGLLETGVKVIDLSADFRLKSLDSYNYFYGTHSCPELFEQAVYGMPELNRDAIKNAKLIAVPGCHASSAIYALVPAFTSGLVKPAPIIVDSKTGSTGAGVTHTPASHHPIRANVIRPYKVVGHRHTAEIEEAVGSTLSGSDRDSLKVSFSAHAVDVVRGILSTTHVFLKEELENERPLFKAFRGFAKDNPFIRFVKKNSGVFKLPDPKVVIGTNFCDIGFEVDPLSNRLVIVTALDNLIKGAAGNAVQCFNIASGLDETAGLDSMGIFPI
ncbi:MAG: N-acetyl-gamma-glutamyl-phosphate reductase [Promethearchaeota archaeon]